MVRRTGDSHRRVVARANYNARMQHSPMRQLANYVASTVAPYVLPNIRNVPSTQMITNMFQTGRRYIREAVQNYRDRRRYALGPSEPQFTIEMDQDAAAVDDQLEARTSTSPKNKMGGKYNGNFRSPHPYKMNMHDKALKYGWHNTREVFGKVVDPNSVYLQHATWDTFAMAETFCGATLRKLFLKAGIPISDRNQIIPLATVTSAFGFKIEFHNQNPVTNAVTTILYETVATDTFTTIISTGFIAYTNSIADFLNKGTDAVPWALHLYSVDGTTGANQWRLASQLDLSNISVTWNSTSEVKIQNRTAADLAAAGIADIDRNDVQPLVGTIYHFNNDPKMKHVGTNNADLLRLQGVAAGGVTLHRGAEFTTSSSYQNRPPKGLWINCTKSANVVLQPGEIKRTACQQIIKGTLKSMFPKLRVEAILNPKIFGIKCQAQLMVFEECIRSVGTNSITLQYERMLRTGCIVTEIKRAVPIKSTFVFAEVNNPAA